MSNETIVTATFSEFTMIKTRGVMKLCFEIPLEQSAHAIGILGIPMPQQERWCCIVPLIDGAVVDGSPKILGADRALRQCHMLCREVKFQRWIVKHSHYGVRSTHGDYPEVNEVNARAAVLDFCLIGTRADLVTNREALERWEQIVLAFRKETGVKQDSSD